MQDVLTSDPSLRRLFGETIPANWQLTRQEMLAHPPHILITNYAMLEHSLLFPRMLRLRQPMLRSRSRRSAHICRMSRRVSGIVVKKTATTPRARAEAGFAALARVQAWRKGFEQAAPICLRPLRRTVDTGHSWRAAGHTLLTAPRLRRFRYPQVPGPRLGTPRCPHQPDR